MDDFETLIKNHFAKYDNLIVIKLWGVPYVDIFREDGKYYKTINGRTWRLHNFKDVVQACGDYLINLKDNVAVTTTPIEYTQVGWIGPDHILHLYRDCENISMLPKLKLSISFNEILWHRDANSLCKKCSYNKRTDDIIYLIHLWEKIPTTVPARRYDIMDDDFRVSASSV